MHFDMRSASRLDRRRFLRITGLGGAAVLAGGIPRVVAADYDPASLELMEFDVSYKTRIMKLPRDAESVQVWMPIPSDDAAQTISDFEVDSPVPFELKSEDRFGARILHAKMGRRDEPFDIEARYRVTRRKGTVERAQLSDAEAKKYLELTSKVRYTPEVEIFARQILGDEKDPYKMGRLVFDGIRENLFYDKTLAGCGTGDTQWIMKYRRGKCDDYHALAMAMLISNGVPVRWEQGFPLPFPEGGLAKAGELAGDCTGSHCWMSFYAPSHGWVPMDVSEGDKGVRNSDFYFGNLSPNRFQVSVGRAVKLNPAQGGDPLPTFAFAYAEADGIPLVYLMNYENVIKYEVTRVEMA